MDSIRSIVLAWIAVTRLAEDIPRWQTPMKVTIAPLVSSDQEHERYPSSFTSERVNDEVPQKVDYFVVNLYFVYDLHPPIGH